MIQNNKFYIKKIENIVFFGFSKIFSELQKINKSLNIKDLIITSSDQKKEFSSENNVYVFDKLDTKFKKFISKKGNISKTIFISFGCRWIFKKKDINFFQNNLLNFHGTRLPYDAGGGGFSWNILRNDRINNQIVHLIEPAIDTGSILMHTKSLFPSYCKIPKDFEDYRNHQLKIFYEKFIKQLINGKSFYLQKQLNYMGRYNPRLSTEISGWINWNISSQELFKFINAFDDPYPGARTIYKGKTVIIKKVHIHGGESPNHPFMSGLVSRHDGDWIVVSTIDENMLLVESITDLKGKNLFHEIKPGDRFYTPTSKLDLAIAKKISYTTKGRKIV
jgi:methionyl-tRNA formyltransferase|tara:strand:+ start:3238 stop:4239 length:1002 start_codon:yes stop_codon:yes gene_type:complete